MAQGKCTAGQLVDPGMTQASLSVPLVAPMTEYGDRINQLDVNIAKTFKVSRVNDPAEDRFLQPAEPRTGDHRARPQLRNGRRISSRRWC